MSNTVDAGRSAMDGTSGDDVARDLDAAARVNRAIRQGREAGDPPSFLLFSSQLQFLLTVGYLTTDQARALLDWFQSAGKTKLPPLAGPDGISGPTMYETLSTLIHFRTPAGVTDVVENALGLPTEGSDDSGEVFADIGDFFSGLLQGIGDLLGTVTDGITEVLMAGTGLIEAATVLVRDLHDLVVLSQ